MRVLITTGQGPKECVFFLERAVPLFLKEARQRDIEARIEEEGAGFVMIEMARPMADWMGPWEWRSRSPFRPNHKRSRWFIEAKPLEESEEQASVDPASVEYQTLRAGGPGGQHQNKTESAVRATWTNADGRVFSVTARSERSQHRNKALAYQRLCAQVASAGQCSAAQEEQQTHKERKKVERGAAVKSFKNL